MERTASIHIEFRTYSNDAALVKERREHIMSCALKVLTKKGYHETTMRELAKACEMSAGALYHYFGSKEEILSAIILNATSGQSEHIEKVATTLQSLSVRKTLIQLFQELCQWHDKHQDITLFVYQETKNLPDVARQHIFKSEERIMAVFESILKKGIESGEFNLEDPKLVAHSMVVLAHAWALRRWYLRQHWTLKAYVQKETDVILKATAPPEGR